MMPPRPRVLLLALAALIVMAGSGLAAPSAPEAARTQSITLRVQTPAYALTASGLRVPGLGTHDVPGAPALPVWADVIELPAGGDYVIRWEADPVITLPVPAPLPAVKVPLPISHVHGDATVVGAGAPPADGQPGFDAVPLADRPDPAIYAADAFYPAALVQAGTAVLAIANQTPQAVLALLRP